MYVGIAEINECAIEVVFTAIWAHRGRELGDFGAFGRHGSYFEYVNGVCGAGR